MASMLNPVSQTLSLAKERAVRTPVAPSVDRFLLIASDQHRIDLLENGLDSYDCTIVSKLIATEDVFDSIDQYAPEIILMAVDSPNENLLKLIANLQASKPVPIVMFAEKDSTKVIQQVIEAGVSAYIADEVQPYRMPSIVSVALARFNREQLLRSELAEVKTKLTERKVLERAKGLLMERQGISEQEAFQQMRKMAMDNNQKLVAVAENIIQILGMLKQSS